MSGKGMRGYTIGSFTHAIATLREYRWQHATNDDVVRALIDDIVAAHEREMGTTPVTTPLRVWIHGDLDPYDNLPLCVDIFCDEMDAIVTSLKMRLGEAVNQICDEQDAYLRVARERDDLRNALVKMFKDYRKATKKVIDPTFYDMTCYWTEELESFGIEVD